MNNWCRPVLGKLVFPVCFEFLADGMKRWLKPWITFWNASSFLVITRSFLYAPCMWSFSNVTLLW